MPIFKTTRFIEKQIDEFFDTISEGGLVFKKAICDYLNGDQKAFEDRINAIDKLEARADVISREVESYLYRRSLIPEHRGDVLGLLETVDNVIDAIKTNVNQFDIESPYIPEEFHSEFCELAQASVDATEEMVVASRAFFRNISDVQNHLHKVHFFEGEADKIGLKLKKKIFAKDSLDLANKIHLRYFASNVEKISDTAEDVANRLAIYTIKRTV